MSCNITVKVFFVPLTFIRSYKDKWEPYYMLMLPVFLGVRLSSCSDICNFNVECFACCHKLQGIILTQFLIIVQQYLDRGKRDSREDKC